MIQFEWPLILVVLPIPMLIRHFLSPIQPVQDAALRVPFLKSLEALGDVRRSPTLTKWVLWVAIASWCCLVVASTRPQWIGNPIPQAVSGRDLLIAVDLSGSMKEKDFFVQGQQVDRLTATKWVGSGFIEKRDGDRLGLILFGDNAYLQVPLTFDRKTVQVLLDEAFIGMAGESTAIGDAIGLAVKRLRKNPSGEKVLILLTDGANTSGVVTPLKAAELAAGEGLKIYTVGIGADEMIVRGFFGNRRVTPSRDLDEDTLRAIAKKTGGRYFRARDAEELSEIYGLLDQLEPIEKEQQYFRPRKALYIWPLAGALTLSMLLCFLRLGRKSHL